MMRDPVCGIDVDPDLVNGVAGAVRGGAVETDPRTGTKAFIDGQWIYFCSLECRSRYAAL